VTANLTGNHNHKKTILQNNQENEKKNSPDLINNKEAAGDNK
jgi:hypothetical protein